MIFDRAVIARTRNNAVEMREAIQAERLLTDAETDPITHQIGHAAKAVGERLIEIGDRLDRHEECADCLSLPQPGLAHK